jgi:uncharacterized protein YbaA (DUF1428 family)
MPIEDVVNALAANPHMKDEADRDVDTFAHAVTDGWGTSDMARAWTDDGGVSTDYDAAVLWTQSGGVVSPGQLHYVGERGTIDRP